MQALYIFTILFLISTVPKDITLMVEAEVIDQLGVLNVLRNHVSISGFAVGGNMAQQMLIIHSSFFKGAGVFSYTFYRCGDAVGLTKKWDAICTKWDKNSSEKNYYPVDKVHEDISNYAAKGLIDNPANLKDKRLYNYVGLRSWVFAPIQSLRINSLFERYIKNPHQIRTRVQDSTFIMPTTNPDGANCQSKDESIFKHFIGNCGFSGAFDVLRFLHGDEFNIRHPPRSGTLFQLQPLKMFNQSLFLKGIENHQMDDVGYYYIPSKCQNNSQACLLHVFLHGCWNSRRTAGNRFIKRSGFLEMGERNNIIMLFPQAYQIQNVIRSNGRDGPAIGCWDAWGVGGHLYATNQGPQATALWNIIQGIIGKEGEFPQEQQQRHKIPTIATVLAQNLMQYIRMRKNASHI